MTATDFAMTCDRPYRKAVPYEAARAEMSTISLNFNPALLPEAATRSPACGRATSSITLRSPN